MSNVKIIKQPQICNVEAALHLDEIQYFFIAF